jgi:DNA sulfur modification protein DndB
MRMKNVVSVFSQFGNRTFLTQMDFALFKSLYEIDVEICREIEKERVMYEREWFLDYLENDRAILLAPFLLSARGNVLIHEDGWELRPENKLFILDGQEKLLGLESAFQYLKNEKEYAEQQKKPRVVKKIEHMMERVNQLSVSFQVYLELSLEEERKCYCDIDLQKRELHPGLKMQYDQRNEYIVLTRKVASKLEETMEIDHKLARVRDQSSALTSLSIMYKSVQAMWEGDLAGKETKMKNRLISIKTQERLTEKFYKGWSDLFPDHACNRQKYVTGLAGIQIALAYTVFLLTKDHHVSYENAIQKLQTLKLSCTWKHDDPLFHHLYDQTTGRIKHHHKRNSIQETARRMMTRISEEVQ